MKPTGVESFIVGDELLLYSPAAQAMYRLNDTAAFIWACIEDGLSLAAIKEQLVELYAIDGQRAARDLEIAVSEWRALGLLDGAVSEKIAAMDEQPQSPQPLAACETYDEALLLHERYYRLLDAVIRIRFADPRHEQAIDAVLMRSARVPPGPYDVAIDFCEDRQGFCLLEGGRVAARCDTREGLPPLLLAQAVSTAYLSADRLIGLHAAAVASANRCLVMPATSGSGKSTLTAALVACGYAYCTDELVVLKRDRKVMTAPVGMSAKSGSWPVLQRYFPSIGSLPVFPRPDGKSVRYLIPDRQPEAAACTDLVVQALVFPSYCCGKTPSLEPISSADALCRLTEAGYDIEGGLDRASVVALIDWLEAHPCYALEFDDLGGAVEALGGLLS